ncbi:isoprenoid synthase domain-containing protein [Aspergillus karnatakaensis]|uniref:terpene synthase family protein n=1 Tax=Aspergillus karnatakaensis TaxID=1810916 RepID=UPI003CCD7AF0
MFHNQEEIWRSIHGQKVDIPNLLQLFPTWTLKLHPEYARARDEVLNPWIRRWVDNERTCYKLQKAEFGIFAAILCADAPYDRFCTVAKYFTWYYLWDDIYDCGTLKGSSAFEMAQYREVSMQYIKHHLLPEHPQPDLSTYSAELQKALLCWEEVGSHIQSVCSQETREILCDEMLNYMQAVGDSNELFDGGKPPSLEAYWKRRDCAAGIYPGIATIPFVYGVDITRSDVSNPAMKKLWKHTSFAVHIANDMLSLRKELNDGQLENLVPVLALNKQLSMNEAMQQATTTPKRTRLAWKNLYTPCERAWGTRDSHWPKPSVKDAQTSL